MKYCLWRSFLIHSIATVTMLVSTLILVANPCYGQNESGANPTITCYGLRGLTQVNSAEPLGAGRLSVNVQGSWYTQEKSFLLAPEKGAQIITNINAISFGVNSYIDIFASLATFGTLHYSSSKASGLGTINGGIQGSLPFPPQAPVRLGAQFAMFAGTSANQINENFIDGYNYFETRTGFDFMGRLLQTLIFGSEDQSIKFHFNEGLVSSTQSEKKYLLLLGGGLQWNVHTYFVLACEGNSRAFLDNYKPKQDPLWITPSLQIRTPYNMNFYAGTDISISDSRPATEARALEPYRVVAGLSFSFDLLANQRKAARDKEQKSLAEKNALEAKTRELKQSSDSLAQKAHADSILMAEQLRKQKELAQKQADSLEQKAKADSIRMVEKAKQDSISMAQNLAETQRKLQEEKAKRSDAEKQLLSTGLLILDAVFFETGKSDISINSKPYLNIIGKMLAKYPKLKLQVAGHTDNTGRIETNIVLSKARAEAVRRYLVEVTPELSTRLFAEGFGPNQPKSSNVTAAGRKLNRRVELQVLNKEVLQEYNP